MQQFVILTTLVFFISFIVSGIIVSFVSGNIRTKFETKIPSIPHSVLGMYHALAP